MRTRLLGSAAIVIALGVGAVVLTAHGAPAPATPVAWTTQFGTVAQDAASAVATTKTGDIYMTGTTLGSLGGTNPGSYDSWVARYDKTGKQLWLRQFGSAASDTAIGLALSASGDVYVVGATLDSVFGGTHLGDRDPFVVKYDKKGTFKWARQFGTVAYDAAIGVAVSTSGDVYIDGETRGALGAEGHIGQNDAFLVKYDKNGVLKWAHQFGSTDFDAATSLAMSGTDVIVSGTTSGDVGAESPAGNGDWFVTKFDKNGGRSWTHQGGTSGYEDIAMLAVSKTGEIWLAGQTGGSIAGYVNAGGLDVLVVRYDKAGNQITASTFGTAGDDGATAIVLNRAGGATLGGRTDGSFFGFVNQGAGDGFLAVLDINGEPDAVRQMGATGEDYLAGVAPMPSGATVVVGPTAGVVWGHRNFGSSDVFLALIPAG